MVTLAHANIVDCIQIPKSSLRLAFIELWTFGFSVWIGLHYEMRTRRPRFESRVVPLFHWVASLGKLFTHIASPASQLQETGVQKGGA